MPNGVLQHFFLKYNSYRHLSPKEAIRKLAYPTREPMRSSLEQTPHNLKESFNIIEYYLSPFRNALVLTCRQNGRADARCVSLELVIFGIHCQDGLTKQCQFLLCLS